MAVVIDPLFKVDRGKHSHDSRVQILIGVRRHKKRSLRAPQSKRSAWDDPQTDALSYPLRAEGKSSFVDSFDATVGVLADGRVFSFYRLGLSGLFTLFLRSFSTFREKNDAMRRFFEADRKNHLV